MDIIKNIVFWSQINTEQKLKVLSRPILNQKKTITKTVSQIINDVRILGDDALYKYTYKFDKINLKSIKVKFDHIANASTYINKNLKKSINIAKKNITLFHASQKNSPIKLNTQIGVTCEQLIRPIESVGIYIPGGSAPLISTVLMLAIPAYLSGCKKIVLCSPPNIDYAILYAAYICNVREIYQIGGAQAIAALAYGTKTIPKVNKIFGPGNMYVTEAKSQISNLLNNTSIDMLAGPSELMIIADEHANADFIASDLISQAEHGVDSQVFLVTSSIKLANNVLNSLKSQIHKISRITIVKKSLKNSFFIITKNLLEAVAISNMYAPEHLIIQTKKPRYLLQYIKNAGSIFLGLWSPESVGDYASGPNHVLPTYGYASSQSGLSVRDFQKYISVQELTLKGLLNISKTVKMLASAEKLDGHKYAVQSRIDYIKGKN
ncbi:histidinol dehydrogenase [Buchnera aphidicola (Nipponaphis monzeni)]|uniref:Histidinol dehydrogenase n=1 Tax=Buchnera aphidicola (Nipponaphis monzeni) TaxID=2495405 RepID=A0A455T9S7_9GAMM|nr:histidinol dehydrogenase [Buchnera aphidicola]BBI01098.1 histidinol dehydrogenase [Buchnera aphidicola (Nipponaphis monzeni)]